MKILQVLPALNSGGVERGTLEIAEAIVRAGHTSVVLSAGGRLVTELESAGSRHVSWDLGRKNPLLLLQVRKLRRWLLSERFDIIHLRSRLPAWMIWLAWRKLPEGQRPHLVTTVHGLHSVSRYSAIMTCGERIIVVSETARRYVLDNYPKADPARIRLIYRGIDPAAFPRQYTPDVEWRADWYATFPSLKNRFVVTLPGRMTRLKGHLDFLRMLVLLREEIPGLRGLIVGGEDPKRRAYAQE
ncbi:MAG: glycosyltransferase, partial [Gammaproteobacteria bacterium]|nr:glycosyltransferase [Gammaproteobacteria bacterium]